MVPEHGDAPGRWTARVPMTLIDRLAEERIEAAINRGDFENLPGAGKPLVLEDDGLVPEELRTAYRLLRTSGFLPPDILILREIRELEDLLRATGECPGQVQASRRLALLKARLGEKRVRALEAGAYMDRLCHALAK